MAGCVVFCPAHQSTHEKLGGPGSPEEAGGMYSTPLLLRMQEGLINRTACLGPDSTSCFGPDLKGEAWISWENFLLVHCKYFASFTRSLMLLTECVSPAQSTHPCSPASPFDL